MYKSDYKNPMSKIFQHEYALYLLMSDLFHEVQCSSGFALETLRLYYMDLVTTGRSGTASYEKQFQIENRISYWMKRDVSEKIDFPMMGECRAKVIIEQCADYSHKFIFTDEIYSFSVSLRRDKKSGKITGLDVDNIR